MAHPPSFLSPLSSFTFLPPDLLTLSASHPLTLVRSFPRLRSPWLPPVAQLLFLRLFTAHLSLSFFVAPLPEEHKTERCVSFVTRRPKKNWVGVREWKEVEVEDEGVAMFGSDEE